LSLAVNNTGLFAGTATEGVFRSTDRGTSWTPAGLSGEDIEAIAVHDTILLAGTARGGIFVSSDNGIPWTETNEGLTANDVRCLVVGPAHAGTGGVNLFAGTGGGGVFVSTDNGAHWTDANAGLTVTDVRSLAIVGDNLFAGTVGGVWRRPVSEIITSVPISSGDVPERFRLEQNFPNPFNPTTNVSFALPNRESVRLKVYDILGKLVFTLVDREMGSGTYTVSWDGKDLNGSKVTGGVYFYRLEAGSFTAVKKMLMVK
jgi:hypothetical protein